MAVSTILPLLIDGWSLPKGAAPTHIPWVLGTTSTPSSSKRFNITIIRPSRRLRVGWEAWSTLLTRSRSCTKRRQRPPQNRNNLLIKSKSKTKDSMAKGPIKRLQTLPTLSVRPCSRARPVLPPLPKITPNTTSKLQHPAPLNRPPMPPGNMQIIIKTSPRSWATIRENNKTPPAQQRSLKMLYLESLPQIKAHRQKLF